MPSSLTPPDVPSAELTRSAGGLLGFARDRLAAYARAESPSGVPDALAACADLIASGHVECGGRVERVPGPAGDHLVTTWGPGLDQASGPGLGRAGGTATAPEPRPRTGREIGAGGTPAGGGHLLLIGHYDTVWPVGRLAGMPYVDDGERIAGPGVFDMKGGLVVIEAAFRVLGELGLVPARQVRLVVVGDEEVGSPDGRRCIEEHTPGAVAALGFESPHPRGVLKTGRRGSTRVRIRVTGREAHAAIDPGKGVSAIDELLDQLTTVRALIPADGSTLLNVGRVQGGTRSNVVAGQATAELGLRFTDLDVERTVLNQLLHLVPARSGAEVEVDLLSNRPAWAAPEPNPLLELVAAAGKRLGQDVTGRPAPGAGDTNLTGAAGVPTLDGFGPLGRGAHAAEESIIVSSLVDRIALLAALLLLPEFPAPYPQM